MASFTGLFAARVDLGFQNWGDPLSPFKDELYVL